MKLQINFAFGIQYRGNGDALLEHEQLEGLISIGNKAVELFGGYTKVNTVFVWRDPDAKTTVEEAGCTISVLEDEGSNVVDDIYKMVQCIKDSLQQSKVAVTRTEVEFDTL